MGIIQFSFSVVTAVVIAQRYEKMTALILSPANYEIPAWLDDGVRNSLKAEPKCTTTTVVADRPW